MIVNQIGKYNSIFYRETPLLLSVLECKVFTGWNVFLGGACEFCRESRSWSCETSHDQGIQQQKFTASVLCNDLTICL